MSGRRGATRTKEAERAEEVVEPLLADPRPRSRPQLMGAIAIYVVCLTALAAIALAG